MKCFSLHFLQAGSLKEPEVSTSFFFFFCVPLFYLHLPVEILLEEIVYLLILIFQRD